MSGDPRVPSAFRTPSAGEAGPDAGTPAPTVPYDPLRLCVATTVSLIAWAVSPAVAVTGFAALGLVGYWRARRAGLLRSRCALGDTRLVLAYLAVALAGGVTGIVLALSG